MGYACFSVRINQIKSNQIGKAVIIFAALSRRAGESFVFFRRPRVSATWFLENITTESIYEWPPAVFRPSMSQRKMTLLYAIVLGDDGGHQATSPLLFRSPSQTSAS